jgi:hypothetical protein
VRGQNLSADLDLGDLWLAKIWRIFERTIRYQGEERKRRQVAVAASPLVDCQAQSPTGAPSEGGTQCELNLPRSIVGVDICELPEAAISQLSISRVVVGHVESDSVCEIDELRAELKRKVLTNREVLEDGYVDVTIIRSVELVALLVAGRADQLSLKGCGIKPFRPARTFNV